MTENTKTPPAKKTIEDPPEYGAAAGESISWTGRGKPPEQLSGETEAGYQQNGQQAVAPTGAGDQAKKTAGTKDWLGGPQNGAEAPPSKESGDWLGGPQNGAETPASNDDRGRVPAADVKKAPKGSLSGGVDEQEGGGPDVSARNPQTGE
ncbi:hypothetical protein [Sinorhizobium meliloti]|uniref:hypothetical protein n=1 Tax=Rhizobium meliloti TaxID=382 RepID=UPI001F44E451|nr:hypothetical protein [Sinorhizobium meliloti]WQO99734.1 hypothetical protein U8C41_25455 [Sinorhizobium meliloti]